MKRRKRILIGAALLAAVLGAAADVAHVQKSPESSGPRDQTATTIIPEESAEEVVDVAPPEDSTVPRGVTPDGRTYGPFPMPTDDGSTGVSTTGEGDLPDLVAVVGDHGTPGYVVSADLNKDDGSEVKNPQEAIDYMENLKKKGPRSLPVYDVDGVTQIDTFTDAAPK